MKKAGAVDASAGDYRSICVNQADVNEQTATVNPVTLNTEGVTQIKNLNPYEWQQAETMASCGGVEYEDFTNIKKNPKISQLGNDASQNMQVNMKAGSWINVRKVDFGTNGAIKFTLRAKGMGTMQLRNGTSPRTTIASIEFSSTEMTEQTIDLPAGKMKGVKNNLYLVANGSLLHMILPVLRRWSAAKRRNSSATTFLAVSCQMPTTIVASSSSNILTRMA